MTCPTCKRRLPVSESRPPFMPFCSERCRLADLGAWLDGSHRITAPLSEEDLDEGLPLLDDEQSSRGNNRN